MIENQDERVWDIVEEVIKEHPVLLNRAPTLHRLGIQAFEPKLIEGKAIRLHPLVCPAFNADFDGDQMAVHVPISEEAQAEARLLMLGANNILSPKDGSPIATPGQDMVLGNYYLTMEKAGLEGEGRVFRNADDVVMAYERREITLHTRIALPVKSFKHKIFPDKYMDKYLVTTPGKIIFNEVFPDTFQYINDSSVDNAVKCTPAKYFIDKGKNIKEEIEKMPLVKALNKGAIVRLIAQIYKRYHTTETSVMLDAIKDLGFKYSTLSGISISIDDIQESPVKKDIIAEANKKIETITKQFKRGLITDKERYDNVIQTWFDAKSKIYDDLDKRLKANPESSITMMIDSKARGSIDQYGQMAGMRGIMSKPNGDYVEIPILSSLSEGVTVSEFFTSTHGTRKGAVDTALKTADAGYLTRRLVDVVQDVIVKEDDCGTEQGVVVEAFYNTDGTPIESLEDRIVGRYTNKKILHPETKEVLFDKDTYITEQVAEKIIKAGVTKVPIRSVLTCKTDHGVCRKCYGRNLATGSEVEIGEAVGIMAAQSIGEPGTQLTMRNFNTGGVAGGDDITQGLPRVTEIFEARNPKGKATISEINGVVSKIEEDNGTYKIYVKNDVETREHTSNYGAKLAVEQGEEVKAGQRLTHGAISPKELLVVTDPITVQEYILFEIQKVYRSQGVDISDKHVEIMARRMISKIRIIDSGDSLFLPGTMVNINKFTEENKELILEGKRPATGKPVLLVLLKLH